MNAMIQTKGFNARIINKGSRFCAIIERQSNGRSYFAGRVFSGAVEAMRYVIEMKNSVKS